jgi:two-component system chemotaxis sensor kinase CheA
MSDAMMQEILAIFREEAIELVQRTLAALNRALNASGEQRARERTEVCRLLHTLKGAAAAADQEEVNKRSHALEDRIAALPPDADRRAFEPVFSELDAIESCITGKRNVSLAAPPPVTAPPANKPKEPVRERVEAAVKSDAEPAFAEWLRIRPERVDYLYAHLGELVLSRLQQDQLIDRMLALRASAVQSASRQRELARTLSELKNELSPESMRKLRATVSGMNGGFQDFLADFSSVCREARVLQAQSTVVGQNMEESMKELRLMPLDPFFDGLGKVVRDAARRTNKQVRFQVQANGAEVDRSVLVRLSDALLHLIRNAVVHGIESPEARKAAKKPEAGTLTLDAMTLGTHVVIRVLDDGAGVNREAVREKALARGVPDAEDILDVLAHPGFSTKDDADDLAGRGVGLNVVQSIVRNLGGTLDLTSNPGAGSVFTIQVPIAASTTMGLIVEVGAHRFGIMLSDVECVVRPGAEDLVQVEGRTMVRVGEELVAVVALSELLGIESRQTGDTRVPVVVLKHARRKLALAVAEIPAEQSLVVRPFGRAFRGADLFLGGAVQPDHAVVPVLSTGAVLARASRTTASTVVQKLAAPRARTREGLRALVVDDSVTMRTLIRNVLTAAGYHVTVAEDGRAGLDLFTQMTDLNVVITDLQMPHMDGVELCRGIRAQDRAYVPIVMVTSVDDDDEKHRALSAGADAYVVKSKFEQASFLERVDTLVRGPA